MARRAVVSSSFCVPYASQFVVKPTSCSQRKYTITDEEGNLLFKVKREGGFFTRMKRGIYDAASGEVLVVVTYETHFFGKNSWVAFRGDGENESQVLFTMRRKNSGWCSSRIVFEVFLPENNDSSNPDFSMEGKSRGSGYSVLSTGTPIAEGAKQGRRMQFSVSVYPETDRAFIAALSIIWIIEYEWDRSSSAAALSAAAA